MIDITRGTTPTISCQLPSDMPIEEITEIWCTFTQNGTMIADKTLSNNDIEIDGHTLRVRLSQEETLKFKTYEKGECGVRLMRERDGMAWALEDPEPITIHRITKDGVIGKED